MKEFKRLEELTLEIMEERTTKSKKWWQKELKYEDKIYDYDKSVKLGITTDLEALEEPSNGKKK